MTLNYELRRPSLAEVVVPELDTSQQAVVDHRGSPLLVLAGPGTGKTTTLVELVAQRIAAGEVRPDEVLMLTFSRKAAEEMRHRVSARLGGGAPVTAVTFHSWCYALLRRHADPDVFAAPPTLMTAAESDAVLADLLAGHDAQTWPAELRPALRTRGFATELGAFLGALAAGTLTTDDLRALAVSADRPLWHRVAEVLDEYGEVTDAANLTDYAELVVRTSALLDDPQRLDEIRAGTRLVVVDEYQDTDPAQVEVLRKLVGPRQQLVAVGDHDQAIYAFRGADADGVGLFPRHFAGAEVKVLDTTRRFGQRVRDAAVAVLPPLQARGLPVDVVRRHRDLACAAGSDGTVEVRSFTSETAEVEHVAEALRRQHLEHDRSWSDMAVLVRTSAQLGRLQRALVEADVPCEVSGDEVPLVAEPAVRVLLGALSAADTLAAGLELEPEVAQTLLTGPLAGVDAPDLRALGRRLRADDRETPSRVLLARAVSGLATDDDGPGDAVVRRLARLLARAAGMIQAGEPTEQVLWVLWHDTDWPSRLEHAWESGGSDRVAADRDLDALVALFQHAARSEERHRRRSVAGFLADLRAQRLPADRLADSTARPAAVRLMTAHRAKGLEWPVVVVAGVQEDVWPDLAPRPSLLRPDLLAGPAPTARERLHEERRVMYVALTRAREHLLVTAVDSGSDESGGPSRFHDELCRAGFGAGDPQGRPARPLSLRGLVTELRRAADDPDPEVRASAAGLLARVAASSAGRARAAHPDTWWGLADPTVSEVPLRDPDQPLGLSGSSLTSITGCSLKWFLASEVNASRGSTTAQGFGLVVHAVAADVVRRGLEHPSVAELHAHLDDVWHRLGHETAWISERERADAHQALTRFATWHVANHRRPLAAEHEFTAELEVDGESVVLRGSMDRVELDADGRVHVVDFKNSKHAPSTADVAEHPQLGVYSLAVRTAGIEGHHDVGGSELVQLRIPEGAKAPDAPKVQRQSAPAEEGEFFVHDLVRQAVHTMRSEQVAATPSTCTFCEFDAICPAKTTFTIGSDR
ncbi:ATP-dependent DNA helicase [Aeromicrobium sp. Leaf350]|uniref:ATP-dependent helicase n=1 Tax=Aeromicrobium sp. Leaf350 TaxID=2876565 RepID=UPI001E65A418|nr:ATP-dependent DNA helicase [Aeromicrobium sp. Leaf350]